MKKGDTGNHNNVCEPQISVWARGPVRMPFNNSKFYWPLLSKVPYIYIFFFFPIGFSSFLPSQKFKIQYFPVHSEHTNSEFSTTLLLKPLLSLRCQAHAIILYFFQSLLYHPTLILPQPNAPV